MFSREGDPMMDFGGRHLGSFRASHHDLRRLDIRHDAEFQHLLLGLDLPSRCSRFGHAASDVTLVDYAVTALRSASNTLGLYVGNTLRGVVEIHRGPHDTPAEAALVVDQQWRRRGFGTALLRAAVQWAGSADLKYLRLIFSRNNWPMRRLAQKTNAQFDMSLDEVHADIVVGGTAGRAD